MDRSVEFAHESSDALQVTINGDLETLPALSDVGVDRLRLLWESRRYIGRRVAIGTLLAIVVAFAIPAQYESTTELMPPDQPGAGAAMLAALSGVGGSGGGGGMGALGGMVGDLLGTKGQGSLFVGILQSRTIEDSLINRFDLRKEYGYKRWEDARKKLAKRTDVTEDRKSGIISIKVSDHSPQRAAEMAQAYVDELNKQVALLSTSSARRERIFLESRIQSVKTDLDTASVDLSQFASNNTAIDIPAQGKAMVEAAATLQGELIAAESEMRGLEQIYTNDNVRVRSMQARISELHRQLQAIGGKSSQTVDDASEDIDSLYPSIRKLPLLGVRYADLFRRVKIQEAVFEFLTKEYELARVQEAKEIPTVKVIDTPMIPERKSFPPRLVIVILGAMLSLGVTLAWLFFLEAWRHIDPTDPRRILGEQIARSVRETVSRIRFSARKRRILAGP